MIEKNDVFLAFYMQMNNKQFWSVSIFANGGTSVVLVVGILGVTGRLKAAPAGTLAGQ